MPFVEEKKKLLEEDGGQRNEERGTRAERFRRVCMRLVHGTAVSQYHDRK